MKIGIKELIKELININGANVYINIAHALYGSQKLQCKFQLFENNQMLGFVAGVQNIYIEKDKINEIGIKGKEYYFADDIMKITIIKLK